MTQRAKESKAQGHIAWIVVLGFLLLGTLVAYLGYRRFRVQAIELHGKPPSDSRGASLHSKPKTKSFVPNAADQDHTEEKN